MAGASYRWVGGSGNFDDPNHWQQTSPNSIPAPAGPPDATDDISLLATSSPSNPDVTVSHDLTIKNQLRIFGANSLSITGDLNILALSDTVGGQVVDPGGATLNVSGDIEIDGSGSL